MKYYNVSPFNVFMNFTINRRPMANIAHLNNNSSNYQNSLLNMKLFKTLVTLSYTVESLKFVLAIFS